ncbi:MAG TPA: isoprenyl transferase [Blastocatellia bacterium]|nr:isoprenyl transferase [Blastocatellia bacterium]
MGNNILKEFEGVLEHGSNDEFLLRQIDPERLPSHIAIIMDGNGRWASRRNQPRVAGHRAGAESVRVTVESAARLGVAYLTLYAFSTENWKRPRFEVDALMALLKEFLRRELRTLRKNNIRFQTIGCEEGLEASVRKEIARGRAETAECGGTVLTVALNYSGRSEIVSVCRQLMAEQAAGKITPEEVTESDIERRLFTAGLPDPDLLVRTSGEMRISNFLLWQIAYSEIYVTDTLWPDFGRANLFEAILEFQRRERRYGDITPSEKGSLVANMK